MGRGVRHARLAMTKRLQGGLRGFLAALDRALDPDAPEICEERPFTSLSAADIRATNLREHRRAKKASRRSMF